MQKVNTSEFVSKMASVLEEQDVYMRTINVELSSDNAIRIEIEGILINETKNQTNK